jgi:hypothetical protein
VNMDKMVHMVVQLHLCKLACKGITALLHARGPEQHTGASPHQRAQGISKTLTKGDPSMLAPL